MNSHASHTTAENQVSYLNTVVLGFWITSCEKRFQVRVGINKQPKNISDHPYNLCAGHFPIMLCGSLHGVSTMQFVCVFVLFMDTFLYVP